MGTPKLKKRKWCNQCMEYGHNKWLFLGTHRTHRRYVQFRVWRFRKQMEKHVKGT